MNPGKLNQQVYLHQRSGNTRDESGAVVPTITRIGPIWAGVDFKETGSDEQYLASQTTAITAVNFTIRNHPTRTVTPTDTLEYRGFMYEIRSVLEADPQRNFLLLETHQMGRNQPA